MDRTKRILLIIFFTALIVSGIYPHDYFTWFLEVLPTLIGLIILVVTYRWFQFSNFTYSILLVHAVILMIGGHWTYAEVPAFNWLRDAFDLQRNYYDRVGHFAQGFVPALVAREIIVRKNLICSRGWQFFFIVFTILGTSAFYEFFEWWVALSSGEAADAFLGTQGDVWDTQWDMFMCFLGSIIALLTLSSFQDRFIIRPNNNDNE